MSLEPNTVNPTCRLTEDGASARTAAGMAGRGSWSKRTPLGNRVDRGDTSPRKRADFQQVVRYERTGRTFTGGNRK